MELHGFNPPHKKWVELGMVLLLVGGFNSSEKYQLLVNWDDYPQYM